MKEKYDPVEMEVIFFDALDVLTSSGGENDTEPVDPFDD